MLNYYAEWTALPGFGLCPRSGAALSCSRLAVNVLSSRETGSPVSSVRSAALAGKAAGVPTGGMGKIYALRASPRSRSSSGVPAGPFTTISRFPCSSSL